MLFDRNRLKGFSKTFLATYLGISRQALYRKLKGEIRWHEEEIEKINTLLSSKE